MFKEMKLSTKFGLALLPLVVAAFALLAFVLGSGDDGRPSLGWIWIAIAGILGSGGVMYKLADSITLRLAALSSSARHMSHEQVPQLVRALADKHGIEQMPSVVPIDDTGSDEIGELADSFNAVQGALVGIASEQMEVLRRGVSEIFVTLARRNRSLVDRQLALLDDLEADVEDPKQLADYYRLDHIATRMRRNAESLLVLARAETRRIRSQPVPIDDVVRAGISEIEDYQRAQPLTIDAADVHGPVVGDLAHMLAELLDNATSFSPPGSVVTISGVIVPGGYALSIEDGGIGLAPERLLELNRLLTTPPVIGLSVEATLGLSVVSLLAEKHGAAVELQPGSEGGIVATIFLPAALFSSGDFPEVIRHDAETIDAETIDAEHEHVAAADALVGRPLPPPSGLPIATDPPVKIIVEASAEQPQTDEPQAETAEAETAEAEQPQTDEPQAQTPEAEAAAIPDPIVPSPVVDTAADEVQLPGRQPGGAAPRLDDRDTRVISDEHTPSGAWDVAIAHLERSASEPADPPAALVLPTRTRGASLVSEEPYAPVAETASDPDELRNKLNAFRSMSSVPVASVPCDPEQLHHDSPDTINAPEGTKQ